MNRLVIRLLSRHISPLQLFGFFVANLIGMAIILLGCQFYQDATSVLGAKDRFMKGDYIIISKQVRGGLFGGKKSNSFSASEIEELSKQDFALRVGRFLPSKFRVSAGLTLGIGMSTYMFFEAVPEEFLDVKAEDWKYDPNSDEVPIIIPRNYLGLYNSAFAQSQGLPLLSEATMSSLPLQLDLSGAGEEVQLRGRIVGFSNRLNTLLVPLPFLEAMNKRLAPGEDAPSTRLIVEVKSPSDPAITLYLRDHHYESEGERLASGESMYLLRLLAGLVLAIGVLISALSVYLLLLSIYLLLQKNTRQIEDLLLLGYTRSAVIRPYIALTLLVQSAVLGLSLVAVAYARGYYIEAAQRLLSDEVSGGLGTTALIGVGIFLITALINTLSIRHKVHSLRLFAKA